MGMRTIFKDEVGYILLAIRLSAEQASEQPSSRLSDEFMHGYRAALEAVAVALGLRMAWQKDGIAANRAEKMMGDQPTCKGRVIDH